MKKLFVSIVLMVGLLFGLSSVMAEGEIYTAGEYSFEYTDTVQIWDDEELYWGDGSFTMTIKLVVDDSVNSNIDLDYIEAVLSGDQVDGYYIKTYEWNDVSEAYDVVKFDLDDPACLFDLRAIDTGVYQMLFVVDVENFFVSFNFGEDIVEADFVETSIDWDIYPNLLDVEPQFSYSELILEASWYDAPSVSEIQAMLSASDPLDGDLTADIELVGGSYIDWEIGDPLWNYSQVYNLPYEGEYDTTIIPWDGFDTLNPFEVYIDGLLVVDHGVPVNGAGIDFDEYGGYTNQVWIYLVDGVGSPIKLTNTGYIFRNNNDYSVDFVYFDTDDLLELLFSVEDGNGNVAYLSVEIDFTLPDYIQYYDSDDVLLDFTFDPLSVSVPLSLFYTEDGYFDDGLDLQSALLTCLFDQGIYAKGYFMGNDGLPEYVCSDLSALDWFVSNFEDGSTSYVDIWGDLAVAEFPVDLYVYNAENSVSLESNFEVVFTLYDDFYPSFDGSASKVIVSNGVDLGIGDLEDYLEISDEYDDSEDITLTVVLDEYDGNESSIGRYSVVFRATDAAGNYSDHELVVWVFDLSPPLFVVDDEFVTVSINDPITEADLVDLLESFGIVLPLGSSIDVTDDEYLLNSDTPGDYALELTITYPDLTSDVISLSMSVVENDLTVVDPVVGLVFPSSIWIPIGALAVAVPFLVWLNLKRKKRNYR